MKVEARNSEVEGALKILKALWILDERTAIAKLFNRNVILPSLQSQIIFAAEVNWLCDNEPDGLYDFLTKVYNKNFE